MGSMRKRGCLRNLPLHWSSCLLKYRNLCVARTAECLGNQLYSSSPRTGAIHLKTWKKQECLRVQTETLALNHVPLSFEISEKTSVISLLICAYIPVTSAAFIFCLKKAPNACQSFICLMSYCITHKLNWCTTIICTQLCMHISWNGMGNH